MKTLWVIYSKEPSNPLFAHLDNVQIGTLPPIYEYVKAIHYWTTGSLTIHTNVSSLDNVTLPKFVYLQCALALEQLHRRGIVGRMEELFLFKQLYICTLLGKKKCREHKYGQVKHISWVILAHKGHWYDITVISLNHFFENIQFGERPAD